MLILILIIGLIIGSLIMYYIIYSNFNQIMSNWIEEYLWNYEKYNIDNNSNNNIYDNKE